MLVDYAFPPHPSPAALAAAGARGVARYLSYPTVAALPKVVTATEYSALRAAGLDVVLNWEYAALDYRAGATGGAEHGAQAVAQARALGYPAGCAIIGSADADVSRADWVNLGRPYYRAFAAAVRAAGYRAGIYGPWDVLQWAHDDGVADVFWQAGMSTAWSGGRNAGLWPGAHLWQRRTATIGGADCDVSDIIRADYGQAGANMDEIERKAGNADLQANGILNDYDTVTIKLADGSNYTVTNVAKKNRLAELADLKAALPAGGVDLDALAQKVAALLLPAVTAANSAAVADELARRLGDG